MSLRPPYPVDVIEFFSIRPAVGHTLPGLLIIHDKRVSLAYRVLKGCHLRMAEPGQNMEAYGPQKALRGLLDPLNSTTISWLKSYGLGTIAHVGSKLHSELIVIEVFPVKGGCNKHVHDSFDPSWFVKLKDASDGYIYSSA